MISSGIKLSSDENIMISNFKICVSAGHHPENPGACFADFCEHAEALKWAKAITDEINFISGDDIACIVPVGVLKDKVKFINDINPLLAIEIHFNSFKVWEDANKDGLVSSGELRNAGLGSETLYYPGSKKGEATARRIQSILGLICEPNRGIKEGWYRMNKDNGPDYFLARTKCTSLIIEPDFIHREYEIKNTRDEACRGIAHSITTGIERL